MRRISIVKMFALYGTAALVVALAGLTGTWASETTEDCPAGATSACCDACEDQFDADEEACEDTLEATLDQLDIEEEACENKPTSEAEEQCEDRIDGKRRKARRVFKQCIAEAEAAFDLCLADCAASPA